MAQRSCPLNSEGKNPEDSNMTYVSLGQNGAGQLMVGCTHVPKYLNVSLFLLPDGSAIYEVFGGGMGTLLFRPSKRTIAIWCGDCYARLENRRLVDPLQQPVAPQTSLHRHGLPDPVGFEPESHPGRVGDE